MKNFKFIRIAFTVLTLPIFFTAQAKETTPDTQLNQGKSLFLITFAAKDKFERSQVADLGFEIESIGTELVSVIGSKEDLARARRSKLFKGFTPIEGKISPRDFPGRDSNFHNYDELKIELENLANNNPDLVKLSSIGRSIEGRELMMLTLTVGTDDRSRPGVFFMGGHHAREHISVETPLNLAKYLAREFNAGNPRVVQLLNSRTIYILPLVNPDGAEYDVASGDYRLWRKNRRNNGSNYGVDLNRNYGFGWGGGGSSSNPRSDIYRGPSAFSEPETSAVRDFFRSHSNISINLSFHTFSELILYPWGHKFDQLENQKDFLVHKTMAETMAQWNGYEPQQSSELYIASGDTTDWAYGELGLISFTFELDPKSSGPFSPPEEGFYPGQDMIETVFQKNIEPCLYLMSYADNPYRVIEPKFKSYGLQSPILK